jgi:hypothetical protein
MLRIDRLVLRLPDDLAGRERALGRAIGAALAGYRPARSAAPARLAATLRDISPAMSDTAIADAVVRTVAARLDGGVGRGEKGSA